MRIAPWGIILLALLGLASVLLGAVSIVDRVQAKREIQAALALSGALKQALDSVSALSCRVR